MQQEVIPPVVVEKDEPQITEAELLEQLKSKADAADKALADLQKYKTMAKEYEGMVKERDAQMKATEEQRLSDQQEYKKLAELRGGEVKEWQEKFNGLNSSLVRREKLAALEAIASKLGMRDLNDVSNFGLDNDVVVETTSTGRINVLGADDVVKKLKQEKPYLFKSGGGNINANDPEIRGTAGAITFEALEKARLNAESSGSYKEYENLLTKYRAQK